MSSQIPENLNPYVKLSQSDFQIAEDILQKSNLSIKSSETKLKLKLPDVKPVAGKTVPTMKKVPKVPTEVQASLDKLMEKRCLICRSPPSSLDIKRWEKDTKKRFDLYEDLVQTLDFNHGLPPTLFMDENLQFCCKICFKALETLSNFQIQVREIHKQMKDIVQQIKDAMKRKSTILLDFDYSTSSVFPRKGKAQKSASKAPPSTNELKKLRLSNEADAKKRETEVKVIEPVEIKIEEYIIPQINLDDDFEIVPETVERDYTESDNADSDIDDVPLSKRYVNPQSSSVSPRAQRANAKSLINRIKDVLEREKADDFEDSKDNDWTNDGDFGESTHDDPDYGGNSDEENESDHRIKKSSSKIKIKKESRKFKCSKCGKGLHSEKYKLKHETFCQDEIRNFKCNICEKAFRLEKHVENHAIKCKERQAKKANLEPRTCSGCGKVFPTKTHMHRHFARIHETQVKKFRCNYCDRAFYDRPALKKHVLKIHEHPNPKKTKKTYNRGDRPSSFFCDRCGMEFKSNFHLIAHIERVHEQLKNFKCPHCEFASFCKRDCNRHVRTVHNGEKRFKCSICGKGFTSVSYKNEHEKAVCSKDPEEILKRYRNQKQFQIKSRTQGQKCPRPECCNYFLTEARLVRHLRIVHGGEISEDNVLFCEHCGVLYQTLKGLEYHKRVVHHQKSKRTCYFCPLTFQGDHYLFKHMAKHTRENTEGPTTFVKIKPQEEIIIVETKSVDLDPLDTLAQVVEEAANQFNLNHRYGDDTSVEGLEESGIMREKVMEVDGVSTIVYEVHVPILGSEMEVSSVQYQ